VEDILERPPVDTTPPALPPFFRRKGGPDRKRIILPDIARADISSKTLHEGVWTIHWVWMARWDMSSGHYEVAHVNTRRYRQWLDEDYDQPSNGIPPHIQFGGARIPTPDQPKDIYTPWVAYAKKAFY
jgi:hypothetical protein